jgi:4-alpha-glucanotransferase
MKDFIGLVGRRAGVIVPLSSLRSRRDFGIGDIGALDGFFDWMESAGLGVLSLLPLNESAPLDPCPYAAISAFAIDPAFADLRDVPEIRHSPEAQRRLDETADSREAELSRSAARARFGDARALKARLLEDAARRFEEREYDRDSERASEFRSFLARNRWLADYALFKTVKEERGWEFWGHWPQGLRDRDPRILAEFRLRHAQRILFHEYVQWILHGQWRCARRKAAQRGILLFGDLPFGLSRESADVWSRREDFDSAWNMGAPPDWYSDTGQDWGLPAYRWAAMRERGHLFWRARLRQASELYDLFRLDHAVGFFRTWLLQKDPRLGRFDLSPEEAQRARGREFFEMALAEAGSSKPVAEDLGVIPPFVREVLSSLGIPGYKIPRWEQPSGRGGFLNPAGYPALSVAAAGTHDTPPLAAWWGEMQGNERERYWEMAGGSGAPPDFEPAHEPLLANLYAAASSLVLLQFQDAAGSRDRINTPATVGEHNWTYRIPLPVEDLLSDPALAAKTRLLKRLAVETGRKTC